MSDKENYYEAEIIGIDGKGGDWCEFWSEIEPIVDKYFGDEWCGSSKPNYDFEKYLWIPCSEREPDKNGDYLVTEVMQETLGDKETDELVVAVESYYTTNSDDGYGAITSKGWQSSLRVIAWMECPTPYIETT